MLQSAMMEMYSAPMDALQLAILKPGGNVQGVRQLLETRALRFVQMD